MILHHVVVLLWLLQRVFCDGIALTPNESDKYGVTVTRNAPVTIDGNNWDVTIEKDNDPWGVEINMDNTWGFHPTLPSKLTLTLSGRTVNPDNTDLIIAITNGGSADTHSKFLSMVIRLDGKDWNELSPGCDTNLMNPSEILNTGDVYSYMNDTQIHQLRFCRPLYESQNNPCSASSAPPATTNSWPLTFIIENYPLQNRTISRISASDYNISCGFAQNMLTDIGHNIYLTTVGVGEHYTISEVYVEYNLRVTTTPTTFPSSNPTTSHPTTYKPTIMPTTSLPTTIQPSSSKISCTHRYKIICFRATTM